jgi:hypothetical protein
MNSLLRSRRGRPPGPAKPHPKASRASTRKRKKSGTYCVCQAKVPPTQGVEWITCTKCDKWLVISYFTLSKVRKQSKLFQFFAHKNQISPKSVLFFWSALLSVYTNFYLFKMHRNIQFSHEMSQK